MCVCPWISAGTDFCGFWLHIEISLGARQEIKICKMAGRRQQEVEGRVQTEVPSLKVFQIPRLLYK